MKPVTLMLVHVDTLHCSLGRQPVASIQRHEHIRQRAACQAGPRAELLFVDGCGRCRLDLNA